MTAQPYLPAAKPRRLAERCHPFCFTQLEDRLALADVLHRPQARLDWEKVERHSTGAVRRGIHSRRTESDEDSDFSD